MAGRRNWALACLLQRGRRLRAAAGPGEVAVPGPDVGGAFVRLVLVRGHLGADCEGARGAGTNQHAMTCPKEKKERKMKSVLHGACVVVQSWGKREKWSKMMPK